MQKHLLLFALLALTATLSAQAPKAINYQAIIRDDNTNQPVTDPSISIQVKILKGSPTGTEAFSEVHNNESADNGLVQFALGTANPSGFAAIKWDEGPFFIKIDYDLSGTGQSYSNTDAVQILSGVFALYAEKAGSSGDWSPTVNNGIFTDKNVGIGTNVPIAKLHVEGGLVISDNSKALKVNVLTTYPSLNLTNPDGIVYYEILGDEYHMFGGDIIGDGPTKNIGTSEYPWNNVIARTLQLRDAGKLFHIDVLSSYGELSGDGIVYYEIPGKEFHVFGGHVMPDNSYNPSTNGGNDLGSEARRWRNLFIGGRTKTGILEVTGGDVAEARHSTTGQKLPAGSVVVFDETAQGKIRLTAKAYDKKVAGVISGAGQYFAGVCLLQEELAKGAMPVAQVGTVEVLCVGPVEVGDLLTSSELEGHAMAITNPLRGIGCTLGKAVTSLKAGERGLVEMQVEKH